MRGKRQKEQPVGFNPAEIFTALALLEKERGIPQDFMLEKITQAMIAAYKKDHPGVDNVEVDADTERRTLRMFIIKTVVAEEDYLDPANEILLEDARKIYRRYEPGDTVDLPVDNVEFGRIAAGNGKQVIIQGLREAERGMVYDEFNSREHEILTGSVLRIDPRTGNATLRIGSGAESTESVLLTGEQIPGEVLTEGMLLKVYVVNVSRSTRGPQILISRTHPGLVRRLFELEVPEIYDGTVEIKGVSREAGNRTKLAVLSHDENVDPVGACVGPKGQRVSGIVQELRGEKIDIVPYNEDPCLFIASALSPAEVARVQILEDGRACRAFVPENQISLAIGREGQNARLAARLTGYKIDIKPADYQEPESADEEEEAAPAADSGEETPPEECLQRGRAKAVKRLERSAGEKAERGPEAERVRAAGKPSRRKKAAARRGVSRRAERLFGQKAEKRRDRRRKARRAAVRPDAG